MVFLFLGTTFHHFLRTWPGSYGAVLALSCCGLLALRSRRPRDLLLLAFGYAWAQFAAAPPRRCDPWLWFLCEAQSSREKVYLYLNASYLGEAANVLRSHLEQRCLAWDSRWGPWLLGMLSGMEQSDGIEDLYRQLGLLHVLVVSGSHFSVLTLIISQVLTGPWRLLYGFRVFSMAHWAPLRLLLESALIVAALIFLLMVGAQAPCQRAFLVLAVAYAQRWIGFPSDDLYRAVFCVQAFLFPSSFFSLSNALSWGATACILMRGGVREAVKAELLIQTMSFAFFGSFSPLGAAVNLLFAPLWDIAIFLAVALVVWKDERFAEGLRLACEYFHSGLAFIASWQERLWSAPSLIALPYFSHALRCLALIPVAFILARTLAARPR